MAACSDGGGLVRNPVEFRVRGPHPINFDKDYRKQTGCSGIDITFTAPSTVGEIVFRNYYVANVKVLVRGTKSRATNPDEIQGGWILSIALKEIMSNPNYETGSHDLVSISATESLVPWTDLVAMRLVLRQPSPLWKTFNVEDIAIYADLPRLTQPTTSLPQIEADRILAVLTKQTQAALAVPTPSNSDLRPSLVAKLMEKEQKGPGGYEIIKLSQV